jgi:hypothetical protein
MMVPSTAGRDWPAGPPEHVDGVVRLLLFSRLNARLHINGPAVAVTTRRGYRGDNFQIWQILVIRNGS